MATIKGIELASDIYDLEDTQGRTATQTAQNTATAASNKADSNKTTIEAIQNLIPSTASSSNPLATQDDIPQVVDTVESDNSNPVSSSGVYNAFATEDITDQVTFGAGVSGSVIRSGKVVQVNLATSSVTPSFTWVSNLPKATVSGNHSVIGYNTQATSTADKCGIAGIVTFSSDKTSLVNGYVPNLNYEQFITTFVYIAE